MVYLSLIIIGICVGSFINALVWRLHEKKDWVSGRSVCVHCHKRLEVRDLVPVFSWLWLRGKCRYCHKPISIQYPLIELVTALMFVLSYAYWLNTLTGIEIVLFAFWLVFLIGLIALALYDLKWMVLPNKLLKPFYVIGIVQALVLIFAARSPLNRTVELAVSFLIGFGLFYLLFQVSKGKWLGGGDVKLGGLLGLVLASPSLITFAIFGASVFGTMYSVPLMIAGRAKKDTRIPFGPFLILGAFVAMLFGQTLISWYQSKVSIL